jgi:hypothetical protein
MSVIVLLGCTLFVVKFTVTDCLCRSCFEKPAVITETNVTSNDFDRSDADNNIQIKVVDRKQKGTVMPDSDTDSDTDSDSEDLKKEKEFIESEDEM